MCIVIDMSFNQMQLNFKNKDISLIVHTNKMYAPSLGQLWIQYLKKTHTKKKKQKNSKEKGTHQPWLLCQSNRSGRTSNCSQKNSKHKQKQKEELNRLWHVHLSLSRAKKNKTKFREKRNLFCV